MDPQRQSHIIKQKTGPDDPELQSMLQEALSKIGPGDVVAIADELAERHARLFLTTWTRDGGRWSAAPSQLADAFGDIARAVTHARANAETLIGHFAQNGFGMLDDLLNGDMPGPLRVAAAVEQLRMLDTRLALEFSTGLLYNLAPSENWLWTRWLWDPTTGTGILPLLAGSVHNLVAESIEDGYARVGAVTAMSMKFGEATGLWTNELTNEARRVPFANSAFLACAYSIYMYGSTGWRLSRDFNDLLPSLPNMARRLLGLPKNAASEAPSDTDEGQD